MKARLLRLRHELGVTGFAAITLLALALAFSGLVVKPLEDRAVLLKQKVAPKGDAPAGQTAEKVAKVYEFLQREETMTDWLAKLHGIGVATGVQVKSANYGTQKTEGRVVRHEIVLPVTGSYGQIRDFLKRALAEIPVMSLDAISVKRGDQGIQAEMRLTLHLVKT